jgi:hypothetical protein
MGDRIAAGTVGALSGILISIAIMSSNPLIILGCSSLGIGGGIVFLYYSWKLR